MKLAPSKPVAGELAEHDELLRPCFKASVRIPSGSAVQLYSGQRATVSFQSRRKPPAPGSGACADGFANDWTASALPPRKRPLECRAAGVGIRHIRSDR